MKTKRVNRYYCDHCKKGGCGKAAMIAHEARCIRNPERVCGFCRVAKLSQKPIKELIKALSLGMESLKAEAGECPACILATIVQSKVNEPDEDGGGNWITFDYKEAVKAFWEEHNEYQKMHDNFYV